MYIKSNYKNWINLCGVHLFFNQNISWLFKGVWIKLLYMSIRQINSPGTLCYVEQSTIDTGQTGNMLYTPKWKFKQNVKCFCLFVYKFKNFVNTWHFSINIIYIHCCEVKNVLVFASKQKEKSKKCISTCLETERKVARVSLVFLFLKLVQINFIFADSVFILPM